MSKINDDKKYYVFLDEIQNIEEFQKAVDGLYVKENIDIYNRFKCIPIIGRACYIINRKIC